MTGPIGGAGAVGGYVPISNEVDLSTLMFTVQSERASLLDGMVREQAAKIQYNNERLKELNQAMSLANAQSQSEDGGKLDGKLNALDPATGQIREYTLSEFLADRGVTLPDKPEGDDGKYTKEQLGVITTNIKNSIDSLTSTSQLDMTQLQSTMSKYNQTFEALSNFISKYFQSLQTITGNLR